MLLGWINPFGWIRRGLVLGALGGLGGCVHNVHVDTHEAVVVMLQYCIETEVAQVGDTNDTLARAYLKNTEGLLVCKGVSEAVLELE